MTTDATARGMLRHVLATLAYRMGKTFTDAPSGFESFDAGQSTRTPVVLVAHIADLVTWAEKLARADSSWDQPPPADWEGTRARLRSALESFDALLASAEPLQAEPERLFQGPLADALTHVGQLALLRRLAGAPVPGENFFRADIRRGRLGLDPQVPVAPFL